MATELETHEISVYVPKSKYKTTKKRLHVIQFYIVLVLLIFVASLPTGFFVFHKHQYQQRDSPPNSSLKYDPSDLDIGTFLDINHTKTTNSSDPVPRCRAPLVPDRFNQCSLPCEWTTMSPLTYRMYYGLMVVGFWIAVIATVVSMITWSKIPSLRKFPHNVRFYLIVCCILLGCCKMLPLRIGLKKVFCTNAEFWRPLGHSSLYVLVQGALCHYFSLANCLWATCFVANTYAVVVRDNRTLFEHSILVHFCQSLLCWVSPAIIIASSIYAKWPEPMYSVPFVDWMGAMPANETISYLSVTLPMQLTLGISLCLLWSITWFIRRSRLDNTRHTIRADEDSQSMRRIERQFMSMTVMILLVLGAVLSVNTTIGYKQEYMVHKTIEYVKCLRHSSSCEPADLWIPLFAVTMLAPGFLCIVFFFLLFMNKDCREIWSGCFQRICRITTICIPSNNTETKSRCSSTLTVLSERRLSDFALRDIIRNTPETKLRASSALGLNSIKPSPYAQRHLFPLEVENRPRSSSTPECLLSCTRNIVEADAPMTSFAVSHPQNTPHKPSPNINVEIQITGSAHERDEHEETTVYNERIRSSENNVASNEASSEVVIAMNDLQDSLSNQDCASKTDLTETVDPREAPAVNLIDSCPTDDGWSGSSLDRMMSFNTRL